MAEATDEKINICWLQEAGEINAWGFQIIRLLQANGFNVNFVAVLRSAYEKAEEKGVPADFISAPGYHGRQFSAEELAALDCRYGPPGLQAIADSNAHFDWLKLPEAERLQVVARHYDFWEKYFEKRRIDYAICLTSGPVATRTLYNLCVKRSIPFAQFQPGPSNRHSALMDVRETQCWSELPSALANEPRPLTAEERRAADEVIDYYSARREPSDEFILTWVLPTLKLTRLRLQRLKKQQNWLDDPLSVAVYRQARRLTREQYLWKYFTRRFFKYDQVASEKFVYFPLYHTYETTTLAGFPYWSRNIFSLVEHLAALLPNGYVLYVKEHPVVLGQMSYSDLKRLKKIKRVKVIGPSVPGRTLIQESEAVILLENNTGWEAFLNRKPVVSLGHTKFYNFSRLVYTVTNFNELEATLFTALRSGRKIYSENEQEWLWFIHCAISTSGEGISYPTEPPYAYNLESKNLQKVADYIAAKVRRSMSR